MYFVMSKTNTFFNKGTTNKSPPEVFEQNLFYPDKSTVWNLGILLYSMTFGANCFTNCQDICNKEFVVKRSISHGI